MDLYALGQYLLYLIAGGIVLFVFRTPLARLAGRARRFLTLSQQEVIRAYQQGLEEKNENE